MVEANKCFLDMFCSSTVLLGFPAPLGCGIAFMAVFFILIFLTFFYVYPIIHSPTSNAGHVSNFMFKRFLT